MKNKTIICPVIVVTNNAYKSYLEYLNAIENGCGVGINSTQADLSTLKKFTLLVNKHHKGFNLKQKDIQ